MVTKIDLAKSASISQTSYYVHTFCIIRLKMVLVRMVKCPEMAIIQEARLPEAFYKAIESGLEPAIEVSRSTFLFINNTTDIF